MSDYYPIIGIETHIELKTESKMFCGCTNDPFDVEPNSHICPTCMGQPGSLPVINLEGLKHAYRAAIAFNCKIPKECRFERKNYFYPDLPKGYQLSSPHYPQGDEGYIEFEDENDKYHKVRLDHLHLEEDAAKLIHDEMGNRFTLVDFNRGGVPLLEIVSDALTEDIKDVETAVGYAKAVRALARAIGISDVNMHKGEMRFDLNVSMKKKGSDEFGNRAEVKNLNSFKALEAAAKCEIKRQTDILKAGGTIQQQTVGFDYKTQKTKPQREKEGEADYRYFPEPNLPPIVLDSKSPIQIEELQMSLPEIPFKRLNRFVEQYGITKQNAHQLTNEKEAAYFYENVCSELEAGVHDKNANEKLDEKQLKKAYKLTSNYIITELLRDNEGDDMEEDASDFKGKITAENFAELIKYTLLGKINSTVTQQVLHEMRKTGVDPSQYIDENDLWQKSDSGALEGAAQKVIDANPNPVKDYKKGKENAIKFLVGQMMRETRGQANPQVAEEILKKLLS